MRVSSQLPSTGIRKFIFKKPVNITKPKLFGMLAEYLKIDEKPVFSYDLQNPFQVAENSPSLPSGQQGLGVPEIRTLRSSPSSRKETAATDTSYFATEKLFKF